MGGFLWQLKVIGRFSGIGKAFLAHLGIKPDKVLKNQEISHNALLKVFLEAALLHLDQFGFRVL
jgi:GTP cyclohydrolase II